MSVSNVGDAADSDSYEFDIFLSYRRSGHGNACQWVHNHFYPLLLDCLADQIGWEPKIFIDLAAETGSDWPSLLENALLRSKMLVAVWSPPYFRSGWCLAEWESMQARERVLKLGQPDRPNGLVYPIIFSDSENFPPSARRRQARDLKPWSNPFRAYQESRDYEGLYREMQNITAEIGQILARAPTWRPDWPIHRPDPPTSGSPDLENL
jgi:hypothetical protein